MVKHKFVLADSDDKRARERTDLTKSRESAISLLLSDQQSAADNVQSALAASEGQYLRTIEKPRAEYDENLSREREQRKASLVDWRLDVTKNSVLSLRSWPPSDLCHLKRLPSVNSILKISLPRSQNSA